MALYKSVYNYKCINTHYSGSERVEWDYAAPDTCTLHTECLLIT